jgi:murein DD-endopeptidase MepM/ murein hydrolase activator NlpD
MKLYRRLAEEWVPASLLGRAIEHERARLGAEGRRDVRIVPHLDALGVPDVFPLEVQANGETHTSVVGRGAGGAFVTPPVRPQIISAPTASGLLDLLAASVRRHVVPLTYRDGLEPANAALSWVRDHFYLYESDHASHLIYATFDHELVVQGMTYGTGFGRSERRAAKRAVTLGTLPCRGTFAIASGGDSPLSNHHYVSREARYAIDLVPLDAGSVHVVSPVEGTVRRVVDGIGDHLAAASAERIAHPFGNVVELEHDGVLYCFTHLRKDSVQVQEGDYVIPGAPIGLIGASGAADEAHLHFHANRRDGARQGVPLRLECDGRAVEPLAGDLAVAD